MRKVASSAGLSSDTGAFTGLCFQRAAQAHHIFIYVYPCRALHFSSDKSCGRQVPWQGAASADGPATTALSFYWPL